MDEVVFQAVNQYGHGAIDVRHYEDLGGENVLRIIVMGSGGSVTLKLTRDQAHQMATAVSQILAYWPTGRHKAA